MELTNVLIKTIKGLDDAKHRRESGLFKVEGTKAVTDTLGAFPLYALFATAEWQEANKGLKGVEITRADSRTIGRMSSLSTPQGVIAVYRIPSPQMPGIPRLAQNELLLALDCIQDPGNLGTIIRTADWYGIHTILASHTTTDVFSPKVVQATMGALARVNVHYCHLADTLAECRDAHIYGTFIGGENLYTAPLSSTGIIVVGNEGRGISTEVAATVTRRITIPPFPAGTQHIESLNASVATAITVSEFRRRTIS